MNDIPRFLVNVLSGPDAGKRFVLSGTCFLGSQESCVIRLTDSDIDPLHARMTLRGDSFTVTDLSTRPAMKVNGRMVKSMKLSLGDTISVGNTLLKLDEYSEEPEKKKDDDFNPRTEIVFVPQNFNDDKIERSQKPQKPGHLTGEGRYSSPAAAPPAAGRHRAVEQKYEEASPVHEERGGEEASISASPVVDRMKMELERSEARRSKSRVVILFIFLAMAGIGLAFYLASMASARNEAEKSFNEAVQFGKSNQGNLILVIERYKSVRAQHGKISPRIRKYLDSEIDNLVAEVARQEAGLAGLLKQLDERAAELASAHSYVEAAAVYRKSDEQYRMRVLDVRKSAIEDLERQSAVFAAKVKEQGKEQGLKLKAEEEQRNKEKIEKVMVDAAQALIDGECAAAVKLLENIAADSSFVSLKAQIDEALTTARLLVSIDHIQALKGPESSNDVKSPVVSAILAIRKNDLWEARAQLDRAKEHLLYSSLLARAKISDEALKREKEAIREFADLWSVFTGIKVSTIPRADDCVSQWKDLTKNIAGEAVARLAGQMQVFEGKHGKTMFAGKYAGLFCVINATTNSNVRANEPVVIERRGSGLGDAKVIQTDGSTVYVESEKDVPETAGYNIGLFVEKTVFNITGTNRAGAVRADVRAIVPYKVLSKRQASFVLPEGLKIEPLVKGDYVLIDKDLQAGPRIISILQKAVVQKVYSDILKDKLGDNWKHAAGAVRLERGKLLIDRSSGVPDLLKKDESKVDLQLLLDAGSDPVKIEFDLLRKTEGGISVGAGDVEFLIGSVDGRKSGIYVKGKLVRPAVFTKPSSPVIPQKVTLIKGRMFAYVAVGKNAAECRISPAVGESMVKRILFSADTKVSIDNLMIWKLPDSGGAQIVAVSQDAKEMIVGRGYENEWDNASRGQTVYVFGLNEQGEPRKAATARIEGFISADKLLCAVVEGKIEGAKESVWLSSDIPSVPDENVIPAQANVTAVQRPVILYGLANGNKDGTFSVIPDMAEARIEGAGFFCMPANLAVHPETGEILAAWAGNAVRCEVLKREADARLKCRPPPGYPVSGMTSNGVIVSRQLLAAATRHDLAGKIFALSGAQLISKQSFMEVPGGGWTERADSIVSSVDSKSRLPPIIIAKERFDGNVQYDFVVRFENDRQPDKDSWSKDLMIQLDFDNDGKGVTFAIGAGAEGGVRVYGRTIGAKKAGEKAAFDDVSFGRFNDLGTNSEIKLKVYTQPNMPALVHGRNYDVRVRRVNDVATFYVNGERLVYVSCPEFKGAVGLAVAAPGRTVNIGRISMKEISSSCRTPVNEPLLGEFGYVLQSDAGGILVDSSMVGLLPDGVVSIVSVEKVVEGERSRTVFLKRAGLGTVKEIGPMTTVIQRNGAGEPVTKGMKILRGTQPLNFLFTDERLNNINEGL